MNTASVRKHVVDPEVRGGGTTGVVEARSALRIDRRGERRTLPDFLRRLSDDENFAYLAERMRTYSELVETRLDIIEQALAAGETQNIENVARALTDACSRLGAMSMVRSGIALQMLGRRGCLQEARKIFDDLKLEHARFKETLICI